jgi:hypothetical protein
MRIECNTFMTDRRQCVKLLSLNRRERVTAASWSGVTIPSPKHPVDVI